MIMTDQDHDGSHIKGLLMNFIHYFYPSLLRVPGFLLEFITPIIKATKIGSSVNKTTQRSFYTMPEYENWYDNEMRGNVRGWQIKYYKGLGTSTTREAQEYFTNIESNRKTFSWLDDVDGDVIDLAFSKKKADERKMWLQNYVPGTYRDHS